MKSLKDNSVYIENKTEQDVVDNDWAKVGNTTLGYISDELTLYDSTTDSVIIDNVVDKVLVDDTVIPNLYDVNVELVKSDNTIISNLINVGLSPENSIPEVSQLVASDAVDGDYFGAGVAMSNDGLVAMVGANYKDTTVTDAGKVYTYKRTTIDDAWTEVNTLTASDAQTGDIFGVSVAVSSDGLVAMVGARIEDTAGTDAGKVYTYKRATIDDAWTEVNQLTASDAQDYDGFGKSVAISDGGLVAVVGANAEDSAAVDGGKVYTYKRATIDDAWTEVNQLIASDAQDNDYYGIAVAISGDGLVAMVSANAEDSAAVDGGKVYTYKRATVDDTWTEVSQLTASDAQDSDRFGASVAISGDGLVAMVGARVEDSAGSNAGKVYIYKRATIDDAWTEVNTLTASDAESDDQFGKSVAISNDGLVIMVGAYFEDSAGTDTGKAYTYKLLIDKNEIDLTSLSLVNPIQKAFKHTDITIECSLGSNSDECIVKEDIYLDIDLDSTPTSLVVTNEVIPNTVLNIDNSTLAPVITGNINITNSNLARINPNIKQPMVLSSFTDTFNNIFNASKSSGIVVTKSRVYLIGTKDYNVVQSAVIYDDDTLGTWRNEDNVLPNAIDIASVTYSKDKVFVIGTQDSSNVLTNVIFSAPISKDGILGVWKEELVTLPLALRDTAVTLVSDKLHVIGGIDVNNNIVKTVYTSELDTYGNLQTFTASAFELPVATYGGKLFNVGNKLYYVGGNDGTSVLTSIYSTTIGSLNNLGAWVTETVTLPLAISGYQLVANGSSVILLGGYDGTNGLDTIVEGTINDDGTLNSFDISSLVLGNAGWAKQACIVNNKLYVIGGYGVTSGDTVYVVESAVITNGWNSKDIDTHYDNYSTTLDISALGLTNVPTTVSYRAYEELFKEGVTSNSAIVYTNHSGTILVGDSLVVGNQDVTVDIVTESNIHIPYRADNSNNPYVNTNGMDFLGWGNVAGNLPQSITEADMLITASKAYIIGGIANGTISTSILEADITAGVIGTFTVSAQVLPKALKGYTLIKDNGKAYIIGGIDDQSVLSDNVYTILLDEAGIITGVATETNLLPSGLAYATGYISKDTIYLLGGNNTSELNTTAIITNALNADRTLGTWETSTVVINQGVSKASPVVTLDRLYLLGGDGVNNNVIQYTTIDANNNIDTFISASFTLPVDSIGSKVVADAGKVYLLGGSSDGSNSTVTNKIYEAIINDGVIEPFTDTNFVIPIAKQDHIVAVLGNNLYIIGGSSVDGYTATVSTTSFDGWLSNCNSANESLYEYVISYADIGINPNTIGVKDTAIVLPLLSRIYDGTMFLNTYDGFTKQGRVIQRKITVSKKDITLLTGLDTELYVV